MPALLDASAPATDLVPGENPLPALPVRRPLWQRCIGPMLVLFCLSGGLAGGIAAKAMLHKPATDELPKARAAKLEPVVELTPYTAVTRIDTLIGAGGFDEALGACKAAPRATEADEQALAYREALCLEALGRWKEAGDVYRRAEPGEGKQAAWARAVLGQVRCAAAADDLASAQTLLDRVLLRSGHPDCAGTRVLEECLFLSARLEALRLGPVRALDPFDQDAVAWPPLSGGLDRYAEWLPPDTLPAASVGPGGGPTTLEVRLAAYVPGGLEVTAHCPERSVADTVGAIAAAIGLKLRMDAATTSALAKETVVLHVEKMPLGELLAALVGRTGSGWKVEGDVLVVAPTASGGREAVARSFRRAISAAPDHPRVIAALVWLANIKFVGGNIQEAVKEYQSVLDRAPEAPEVPHAVYNLGLAELRTGAIQSARSRFVDLVDRAPQTRWADYGWWWVGRTRLDVGDQTAAKKAFQRVLRGQTRETTSAAAIGLCACELLDGNDDAARTALRDSRLSSREQHLALGTMFECLLHYRATPTEGRRAIVLTALRDAGDGRFLGPGGTFLVGRVYRNLGMPEKTAALYDAATDTSRGPLAIQMTFDAAEWYDLLDKHELARQRYLAVAATDPKGLGPQAELRLAQIALRRGNPDECLARCRALVDRAGVDRSEVLAIMGRGYETQRNYRFAAECFAGRVPGE